MHDFNIWFSTGVEHIADLQGYDHILFLLALCGVYPIAQWKKVLINITAFTIGHTLTLALSSLNILNINTEWVELLIPITILLTCLYSIRNSNSLSQENSKLTYLMACFFGLIHGLGFSTLLKHMLGHEQSILLPLFSFNLGLEIGQLFIVMGVMIFSLALTSVFKIKQHNWVFFISSAVFGIALMMTIERLQELIK